MFEDGLGPLSFLVKLRACTEAMYAQQLHVEEGQTSPHTQGLSIDSTPKGPKPCNDPRLRLQEVEIRQIRRQHLVPKVLLSLSSPNRSTGAFIDCLEVCLAMKPWLYRSQAAGSTVSLTRMSPGPMGSSASSSWKILGTLLEGTAVRALRRV